MCRLFCVRACVLFDCRSGLESIGMSVRCLFTYAIIIMCVDLVVEAMGDGHEKDRTCREDH